MTQRWWADLFQLLLENTDKPSIDEIAKSQPIWCIRGGDAVVLSSIIGGGVMILERTG